MSADQNTTLIRRWFDEVCNGRKGTVADEIFAADHQYHDPQSPWVANGPDGMKQLASTYYTAFPDAHWTVHEVIATDNTAVARWTGSGTQQADLPGIPATGKRVNVDGLFLVKVRNGKIAESYDVWDTLGMMQQLGVVPQMA